jgi:hypothetical protein
MSLRGSLRGTPERLADASGQRSPGGPFFTDASG